MVCGCNSWVDSDPGEKGMKNEHCIKNCKVVILKETFAIVKSKMTFPLAFANIVDKNEITVVIDQSKVDHEACIKIENGWKLLTFDMVLPFSLVGFLSKISTLLSEEKIPLFVISSYSTDHILIKEKDLVKAKEQLEKIGCVFEEK